MTLNEKEIIIVRELLKANRPLTIYHLAKRTPYSWITINKYVTLLVEKDVLQYTTKTIRRTKVYITDKVKLQLNSQTKAKGKQE